MTGTDITIREIQHYLYCPHRWGLMQINCSWDENYFVTKAKLLHERVHNPDKSYTLRGRKVFTSVPVYNDEYGLYGVTDCIECTPNSDGVEVMGSDRRYNLCVVEYKPTQPKDSEYNYDDLMQVFAQKVCIDYVFGCDCNAVLYYANVRKRIQLPVRENFDKYDADLRRIISEIRYNTEKGIIPPIMKNQKCSGCSMKDMCMPKVKSSGNVHSRIIKLFEDERI